MVRAAPRSRCAAASRAAASSARLCLHDCSAAASSSSPSRRCAYAVAILRG